ncbi:hypothetical protein V6N11_074477 [Hibiscus sabdariffa]|uniref:Uncharacterized protein n=1 Tax=Hibiscus sabdariffa TaxID=183260 RepID=A0ABR2R3N3_9ROSI
MESKSSIFEWVLSRLFCRKRSKHPSKTTMAIRLPRIVSSKKVPKGHFAVYVGENQKRFVIPVSFLNQPLFQELLGMSEDEFGYSHPTGGLKIPCKEDLFVEVTSRLN